MPASPPDGHCSASSSPMTSPRTAPCSYSMPKWTISPTSAPRGPISSACTGTARSAIPSCTTAVDSGKLLIGTNDQGAPGDLLRNVQGVALSATRETTCTCSSPSSTWPCSGPTTCWSTGSARTASPRPSCSRSPAAPRPGTTSGSSSTTSCPRWSAPSCWPSCSRRGPAGTGRRGRPTSAGIRRRRLPLRPQPDPPQLPLQAGGPELPLFPDLLGFQPVPASRRVDWTQLFAFPAARHHSRARRSTGAWPAR